MFLPLNEKKGEGNDEKGSGKGVKEVDVFPPDVSSYKRDEEESKRHHRLRKAHDFSLDFFGSMNRSEVHAVAKGKRGKGCAEGVENEEPCILVRKGCKN